MRGCVRLKYFFKQGSMTDMLGRSGRTGTNGRAYSSVKHIPHRKCLPIGSNPRRWRKRSINRVRHCRLLEPMYLMRCDDSSVFMTTSGLSFECTSVPLSGVLWLSWYARSIHDGFLSLFPACCDPTIEDAGELCWLVVAIEARR